MTVKITLACTECKQRNYNKEEVLPFLQEAYCSPRNKVSLKELLRWLITKR